MTNFWLIVFGFLELIVRGIVLIVLVCTVVGAIFLMDEDVSAILSPTLWGKVK